MLSLLIRRTWPTSCNPSSTTPALYDVLSPSQRPSLRTSSSRDGFLFLEEFRALAASSTRSGISDSMSLPRVSRYSSLTRSENGLSENQSPTCCFPVPQKNAQPENDHRLSHGEKLSYKLETARIRKYLSHEALVRSIVETPLYDFGKQLHRNRRKSP